MMSLSIPEVWVEDRGTGPAHDGVHGGRELWLTPASMSLLGLLLYHLFALQRAPAS